MAIVLSQWWWVDNMLPSDRGCSYTAWVMVIPRSLGVCYQKQAGAELGQAQIKLGLVCTNMINIKYLARFLVSFCSLRSG